ncbi:MAG TPA: M64 family metallopeptidase [Thermoanaerobaculia bacterium]|nr:M64 family metallopeptidase [Thermoanaerobaculia bacterium]
MPTVRAPRLLAALGLVPLVLLASTAFRSAPPAPAPTGVAAFDSSFVQRTMRVELAHTGGPGGEVVALDRVVSDGAWAGSTTRLADETNLGTYQLLVLDRETNRVLYSRGYSSLYAEWETTPEAKRTSRTFRESLRFPWPKRPVQVVLKRRDQENLFKEVASFAIDPDAKSANPAEPPRLGRVVPLFENGPPQRKVDLLVLGDGYTEAEMPKLRADAARLVGVLFETEPFKSRKADFNVRMLELPTSEPGVLRPQSKIFRRTFLGTQYDVFGSERYVLAPDERPLRDAASNAPYEFLEVLVNDAQYGGGGIYSDQATSSADTAFAPYIFVHEFGHHFAGLADEYYTSPVAYETGAGGVKVEPWEPNVTALHDPERLKWKDLVAAGTPLPTPWEKETFETESKKTQAERKRLLDRGAPPAELDALFRREREWETKLLSSMKHSGRVGAFEGAAYEAKGLYRPAADCIMFTRDDVGFCPVCRRAIEKIVDLYARP